ncbi:hypothetical protein vseg_002648 [Gypsophila vaccaria]
MNATYLYYVPLAIIIYTVNEIVWRKLQKSPPGPLLSVPILGQLYALRYPITDTFTQLAEQYGPVFCLKMGTRQAVVVSTPWAAEECLSVNDVVFCNRPQGSMVGKYIGYGFRSINFAPYGAHWKNLRKLSAIEILSPRRVQSLSGIRAQEVESLVKRLYGEGAQHGVVVADMRSLFLDTTINIMTKTIFGKRYVGEEIIYENNNNGQRIRQMLADTVTLLNKETVGDYVPWLKWLDWKIERAYKKYCNARDLLLTDLVEEHKLGSKLIDHQQHSSPKPLVQVLLELQHSDPHYYNDHVIQSIIFDLLFGGSDTSAGTMDWAFSLLLNHPNVLKKAQAEIDSHVGYERFVKESDLNQLPYLGCIINETLRMYPPIPHLLPHEASKDCVVGGYRISKGSMLQVNAYTIQNDPTNWDDPTSFRPERFEGVDGHRVGYKMFPFGLGRRSCPGEGLAIRVIGLTIASLIQCFDCQRVSHDLVDMTKFDSFNLQRAKPLQANIPPRQLLINLLQNL